MLLLAPHECTTNAIYLSYLPINAFWEQCFPFDREYKISFGPKSTILSAIQHL